MNSLHFIVVNEAMLRLGGFAMTLALLVLAECTWPSRGDNRPAPRQLSNFALMAIDTALLRLAFPVLAVALAMQVHARGGGLFGVLAGPAWLEVSLAVLIFDAAIYGQHRLLHRIPLLWRLHRAHHSDIGLDVTTGVRFHPLEIGLSMAIKLLLVAGLGPHPAAVVIFEWLLSTASLFTHADVFLPARAERVLRAAIVTPAMHRIHHSVRFEETNSNYGFLLSQWDRLFGSYRARASEPEFSMPIGLPQLRDPTALGLLALLLQPFRRVPAVSSSSDSPTKDTPHA